jgi:hypothetical protein
MGRYFAVGRVRGQITVSQPSELSQSRGFQFHLLKSTGRKYYNPYRALILHYIGAESI